MIETCWENKGKISLVKKLWPIPVAASSKALVCGRSLAGIEGSNSAGGRDVRLLCCQVDVSATG